MRTIHRDIVSALIFSKDGKLLMGMKDPKSGGVYADCWHIPGGGVDEGETQEQALRREMLEEVGIDIADCKVTFADDQGDGETEKILKDTGEKVLCKMQFYVYRVDVNKNADTIDAKPSDDLIKLEWVDLNNLNDYKLTPPSQTLFERLGICSTPIFTVHVSDYQIIANPDYKTIGKTIDDELRKHFMGKKVVIRCIGSQDHPDLSLDELTDIVLRTGTDKYDQARMASAMKSLCARGSK